MFLIFLRISGSNVLKMFLFKKCFSAGRIKVISYLTAVSTSIFCLDTYMEIIANFLSFLSQEQGIFACAYELPYFNAPSQPQDVLNMFLIFGHF